MVVFGEFLLAELFLFIFVVVLFYLYIYVYLVFIYSFCRFGVTYKIPNSYASISLI